MGQDPRLLLMGYETMIPVRKLLPVAEKPGADRIHGPVDDDGGPTTKGSRRLLAAVQDAGSRRSSRKRATTASGTPTVTAYSVTDP